MKVKVNEIEKSSLNPGFVRLSANVDYDDGFPSEVIWFDVEESYQDALSRSGNPWVTCLLPLAVQLKQDLYIDKPCDYQLLQNLEEIASVWNSWNSDLQKVNIYADVTVEAERKNQQRGAFFSGGVDSFFTVLSLEKLAKKARGKPLTDLVLVWGFDIPLSNSDEFLALSNTLKVAAGQLNKNLIRVITNLRLSRFNKVSWGEYAHGSALASVGFALENYLEIIYLGSTHSYKDLVAPWGSHPLVDNLFYSSGTQVYLHGSPYQRTEKIEAIVDSEVAMSALHVCWQDASHKNCGQCNKCYRTMISMEIVDALKNCSTFESKSLQLADIARLYSNDENSIMFMEEVADFAYRHNKPDIAQAVLKSIRMSRRINRIAPTLSKLCAQWPFRRVACFISNQIYKRIIR